LNSSPSQTWAEDGFEKKKKDERIWEMSQSIYVRLIYFSLPFFFSYFYMLEIIWQNINQKNEVGLKIKRMDAKMVGCSLFECHTNNEIKMKIFILIYR